MKILMVCLGNICRSPLAEGILQQLSDKTNLDYIVASAGTGAYYNLNSKPNINSIQVAKMNGVDINHQLSRQFVQGDITEFDIIYVMDKSNMAEVKAICGQNFNQEKVHLLMNEAYPNQNREVPDPYKQGIGDFERVYAMIAKACVAIIDKHKDNASL